MWFAILGPLLIHDGETPVEVPKGRQRVLLAALLLHAGSPVAAPELAEMVWDGSLPSSAAVTLRSHVLGLRRVLGQRAGARLLTRYPGYLLQAGEDEVDVLRFRRLCRDGGAALREDAWDRAHALLGEALDLWRGVPLADVPSESLRRDETQHLDALRLQAEEWRIDAALHLGRHAETVPALRSLTAEHPLLEAFHGHLMLALYRCGRQAEALTAYQRAREILAAEVGVEPGPALQELHHRILSADPALVIARPTRPAKAEHHRGTPRQLPSVVAGFTGRAGELKTLSEILDDSGVGAPGTVVISAIGGTAGVGKTALALFWAHQVADRFADGQLYVNLRGFDPSGNPATPTVAVRGFLDALGVPPNRIPPEADAQAALYRSLMASKQMLIVLDNALDEQQVRPLLPASPASLVIVTSRSQLAGLAATDGARLLSLDVLTQDESVHLLIARIGKDRAAAEPGAVGEIAALCARLPLALAVTAAQAAAHPSFPLRELAAELRGADSRLDALDAGDPASSVRAVFSWSYRQLNTEAARLFRLLGLHPGPDVTAPAAASAAGVALPAARRCLRELTQANLLSEHLPGRFGFHDLLCAYAADQARAAEDQQARRVATGRILDHYLHTAAAAASLINPARRPITVPPPLPGVTPERLADYQQALTWMQAEYQVLLAATTLADSSGLDSHAWQIPCTMAQFLALRGHWRDMSAAQGTALGAARRLKDTAAQAESLRLLADAARFGDQQESLDCYMAALRLYQQLGDHSGETSIQQSLIALAADQGRHADALSHAEQALRLCQDTGNRAGPANALNNVGYCHALIGDYQQARVLCQQAVSLSAELGHRHGEAYAWDSLGYAEHHLGNLAEAITCYLRALSILREFGDRYYEAAILTHLGDTRHACGDLRQARQTWQQALDILDELDHSDAQKVRGKLASTADASTGDVP